MNPGQNSANRILTPILAQLWLDTLEILMKFPPLSHPGCCWEPVRSLPGSFQASSKLPWPTECRRALSFLIFLFIVNSLSSWIGRCSGPAWVASAPQIWPRHVSASWSIVTSQCVYQSGCPDHLWQQHPELRAPGELCLTLTMSFRQHFDTSIPPTQHDTTHRHSAIH